MLIQAVVDAPKPTDWINAIAQCVAAIGTVGALFVGSFTLWRQVKDKHREQASGVTVGARHDNYRKPTKWIVFVLNSSKQPLYDVHLHADEGTDPVGQGVLAPAKSLSCILPLESSPDVKAEFKDAAGNRWRRMGDGALDEIKPGLFSRARNLLTSLHHSSASTR